MLAVSALASAALIGAGCGSSDNNSSSNSSSSSSGGSGKSGRIALLLPENKTARYEAADRPDFTNKVKALCPGCTIDYSNAQQDAAKQQSQAEAAITAGAKVLVVDPVDSDSAAAIARRAKQSNIPVIAYDRLINGAPIDYYISFDNIEVGKLQGNALIKALGGSGKGKSIVMINGSPQDNNAGQFKKGAHDVLDASGVKIAKEYDTPDWSPDKAQTEAEQAITSVGKSNIDGIYSANDGMATGIVAAMKGAGIDPTKVPVTGQDAEVAGIQRILLGQQAVTIYKAVKPEAEAAAELAVALLQGKQPPAGLVNQSTDNGAGKVKSVILKPQAVTADNVKDTVIADKYVKASDVCTGPVAKVCKAKGIS
jgi:D-xylose transport system substrate-binding protein